MLGHHEGAFLFTVGQRKGFDLGGGPRRYVTSTDVERNVVYVTADPNSPALLADELELEDTRWVAGSAPAAGTYQVRCRHTGALLDAQVEPGSAGGARVRFLRTQRRVAPGQSVVVYDGLTCLGGGLVAH